MAKPTGFLEYKRNINKNIEPPQRIHNYNEFHTPLTKEQQIQQAARCMDCGVPFCHKGVEVGNVSSGCPLHNYIPEWNYFLYFELYEEALARLLKTNNFPEFTSRVCPALCEGACTCGLHGEPVTIRDNERSIIEYGYENGLIKAKPPTVRTNKKIAIVGSGPCGLAAADQLNQRGHRVSVFERADRVGGLLMYGIPNMKLEKHIINRKIKLLQEEGIEFKVNADIGKNIQASYLLSEYDAIILACGASLPRDIQVKGRNAKGIYFAVDYLSKTTKSLLDSNLQDENYISANKKDVVIIGGGDTGNDCVATALRQGAKSVIQLEMMPALPLERTKSNPWPEYPNVSKTDYGQEEAIYVFGKDPRVYQTTVKEFIKNDENNLKSITTVKLEPKIDDTTGRQTMVVVEGSEEEIKADLVLIAAGFIGSESYIYDAFQLENSKDQFLSSNKKVFIAGDMRTGQSLVVKAINEGRQVAKIVDETLMGYTNLE